MTMEKDAASPVARITEGLSRLTLTFACTLDHSVRGDMDLWNLALEDGVGAGQRTFHRRDGLLPARRKSTHTVPPYAKRFS